jgi:hypothetical protein
MPVGTFVIRARCGRMLRLLRRREEPVVLRNGDPPHACYCRMPAMNGEQRTSHSLSIDVRPQPDRQPIKHRAAARRRTRILMHGNPYARLEVEDRRQHALKIRISPCPGS